jgi:glycosyltransferase involved in cell wall biosynthesis
MRVALVTNHAPFVYGGAELLTDWLGRRLEERGHEVEVVRLPFRWHPPQKVLDHLLAARLLRVPDADRVVALKFPAYYIPHHSKVLWLLHQFRQAYDLWGTRYGELPDTPEGRRVRQSVITADNVYFHEAERIYTNSRITSERLKRHNGFESEVLYPPVFDETAYRSDGAGDYVFYPSRMNSLKRQQLLVQAMAHVRSGVRLVLAGSPDAPEHLTELERQIAELGVEERVELIGSWIPEQRKRDLFAGALACAYVPYDEDSYGYVTLESFHSRKPVITCTDSGGTLELVEHAANGYVVEPQPEELAGAMDELMEDRTRAIALGEAAYETLDRYEISWDAVVAKLLA